MERIAKERLNIILLVDSSKSMAGGRIARVGAAIEDIKAYLVDLQQENSNVDFYLTLLTFSTAASFYKGQQCVPVDQFKYDGIKCGGYSNLHCAYEELAKIMKKESRGGIMPDFGGVAPIILLLTDGHPTGNKHVDALQGLEALPWFKVALRYGVAIELDDKRTGEVLRRFVGNNGDVITCYDATMLQNIIKIIVLTASKVSSTSAQVSAGTTVSLEHQSLSRQQQIKQLIGEALSDADNWEW